MSHDSHTPARATVTAVLDPVFGMTISPDDAVGHVDHKGTTYYFCSDNCVQQFRANPDALIGARQTAPADMAPITKVEWACPMHPEIVRDAPGSCPDRAGRGA